MLTFVSAVEFDIKKEQTLSSILDMSKANVKITFLEKNLLCVMRIESCQWVGESRTEKEHCKSKVVNNGSQRKTPYSSST